MRNLLIGSISLAVLAIHCPDCFSQNNGAATTDRYEHTFAAMGVAVRIVGYAPEPDTFDDVAGKIGERFAEIEKALSDYDRNSEASRLCNTSPHSTPRKVSRDLYAVLEHSQAIHRMTSGSFDPSVAPLSRLWRMARKRNRLPSERKIAIAREGVGFVNVQLVSPDCVQIKKQGVALDFGGIGKGYAAEQAIKIGTQMGIASLLVDIGGDIAVSGPPSGKSRWRIQLQTGNQKAQKRYLNLANRAVATSGDLYQRLSKDGIKHSHIIDPQTGEAVTRVSAVTVISNDAIYADALASAVCVMQLKPAIALIESLSETEARVEYYDFSETSGNRAKPKIRTIMSSGFASFLEK